MVRAQLRSFKPFAYLKPRSPWRGGDPDRYWTSLGRKYLCRVLTDSRGSVSGHATGPASSIANCGQWWTSYAAPTSGASSTNKEPSPQPHIA